MRSKCDKYVNIKCKKSLTSTSRNTHTKSLMRLFAKDSDKKKILWK